MRRAQQQAHDVRGDQADEAHRAGDRHARADGQGDLRHQPALQSFDIDADMARLALAQRQGVEQVRGRQQGGHGDREDQQRRHDRRPGDAAEAAHGPEDQGAQLLVVGDEHQHADAGRGQRIDGDAGEQQGADQGDAFARGQAVDDRGRYKAAAECRDRQQPGPEIGWDDMHHPLAQHDHRHGRQRRTARHAEQAGIGQGIAEQALQGGTTGGQRRADAEGRQHARRADGVEHHRRGVVDRLGRQADRREEVREPHWKGADAQAADDAGDGGKREERDGAFEGEVHGVQSGGGADAIHVPLPR